MAGYTDLILASLPTAYWRLNEASGSIAADSSGNGRDLTLTGVTLNEPGLRFGETGPSAFFSGSILSYALRNPFTGFPSAQFTLTFMVKTPLNPTAPINGIFSYASTGFDNNVLLYNAGNPSAQVRNAGAQSTGSSYANGQPNHGAVTWRSSPDGRVQFWLNGRLMSTVTGVATTVTLLTSGAVVLGQDQDSVGGGFQAADAFQGWLQDVALFPTVLADSIIERQANIALYGINANVLYAVTTSQNRVRVYFDLPMQGLGTAGNFVFSGGLTSSSTTPSADRRFVDIVTTGMTLGSSYTLTVGAGVTDDAGNALTVNVVTFVARMSGSNIQAGLSGTLAQEEQTTLGGGIPSDAISGIRTTTPVYVVPTQYTMRAYRALTPGYVFWTVSNNPDFTGAQSGYPPVELSDIVVEQSFCALP